MTTNKDKQREDFIAFANRYKLSLRHHFQDVYAEEDTAIAWIAWQAAQGAIRLPDEKRTDFCNMALNESNDGWNNCRAEVIRLNGLGDK